MNVDLRQLIAVLRRRSWILIVFPAIAGLVAYGVSSREAPQFAATSVIRVNPASTTGTADYYAILSSQSLIETYRQLIKSRPVIEAVIGKLSLPYTVPELQRAIAANSVEGTQLVQITASDPDPTRAAAISNSVGVEFQKYVADQAAEASSSIRSVLDRQIGETKQQIDETAELIQQLESTPARSTEEEARLSVLRTQLGQLQDTYGELLNTSQSMVLNAAAGQAQVTVSESAMVPTEPFAPRVAFRTVLSLIAGLLVAGATVFVVEYLDDTVTASATLSALAGAPVLATIDKMQKLKKRRRALFALDKSNVNGVESIRLLRTNLEFVAKEKNLRSFAFASSVADEGKSTIVANLAVVMAQVGIPVVVIDADMWHSTQHELFQARNDVGLSTLLARPERSWNSVALTTGVPNLRLITSGPLPPDPADLLRRNLKELVDQIVDAGSAVLIDTPPILVGADTLIVSGCVDGIVLICRDRHTRNQDLRRAISFLRPAGAKIVGVVLNQRLAPGREQFDSSYRSRKQERTSKSAALAHPVSHSASALTPTDSQ